MENKIIDQIKTKFTDQELYQKLKHLDGVIAGGAITSIVSGRKINDFDIYFKNKEQCEKAIDYLINHKDWNTVSNTDNAVTFKRTGLVTSMIVQFIKSDKLLFEDPKDLINSFDFTINMAAFEIKSGKLYMHENFKEHIMQRKLIFNENTIYPIISMHRAIKYIQRGYKLSGYEQVKIALAINNLKMENYMDLKIQLQGIDTLEFAPLTDKLMKNPDKKYDYKTIKEEIKYKENLI